MALSTGDTKRPRIALLKKKKILKSLYYTDKNSSQNTFKWKYPTGIPAEQCPNDTSIYLFINFKDSAVIMVGMILITFLFLQKILVEHSTGN